MLCQLCGKRIAVVIITAGASDGTKFQVHLCEECAKKYNIQNGAASLENMLEMMKDLAKVVLPAASGARAVPGQEVRKSCDHCGRTYKEFLDTKLLGCPACYDQFRELLEPIISQAQVICPAVPAEKAPESSADGETAAEKQRLEAALKECIAQEKYEQAALIRDQLAVLNSPAAEEGHDELV